jgi:hypothetical protein
MVTQLPTLSSSSGGTPRTIRQLIAGLGQPESGVTTDQAMLAGVLSDLRTKWAGSYI